MRHGQAAMEFLATYGWALLIILVAIGALTYMGIIDVSKTRPESCLLDQGFSCDNFAVQEGNATLRVQNNFGRELTLDSVIFTAEDVTCDPIAVNARLDANDQAQLDSTGCDLSLTPGTQTKIDVQINYSFTGSSFQKQTYGTMTVNVE